MPEWTSIASVALNVAVIVAGVAYGAGIWRERVEAKDIKRRLADVVKWLGTHDRADEKRQAEIEDRFDEASGRMSTLASKVQAMPDQIEERVARRYYEAGVARAEIAALDRRLRMVEDRLTMHNGKAIHDR